MEKLFLTTKCFNLHRLYFKSFLIFCIFLLLGFSEALAQWRAGGRFRAMSNLDDEELKVFARMSNITSIFELLDPILVERIVDTPSHRKVGEYLKQTVETYGFTAEWDIFDDTTPLGKKTFRNLIATFDPHRNIHRRIVLACHYDSKIIPNQVFIAATDSAVPCALLLDLAKTLGPLLQQQTNNNVTLQLVFLDGEEAFVEWTPKDSIYGARHLAELWEKKWYPSTNGMNFELSKEIDRIDVFVLLDLLGASHPRIQSTYGLGSSVLFQYLPEIEAKLKWLSILKPTTQIFWPGDSYHAIEDDHIPFRNKGIPIMHLISVPFPAVWHTPRDNKLILDKKVIYNLATIIRVFVARYLGLQPLLRSRSSETLASRASQSRPSQNVGWKSRSVNSRSRSNELRSGSGSV